MLRGGDRRALVPRSAEVAWEAEHRCAVQLPDTEGVRLVEYST